MRCATEIVIYHIFNGYKAAWKLPVSQPQMMVLQPDLMVEESQNHFGKSQTCAKPSCKLAALSHNITSQLAMQLRKECLAILRAFRVDSSWALPLQMAVKG
jgi:hypothetical protein